MRLRFPVHRVRAPFRSGVLSCGLVVATALSGISQPAAAIQNSSAQHSATDAASTPSVGKKGKVCKTEDVTGSRMPKRVCHTPEQWEARGRAGREAVRELDARAVGRQEGG